MDLDEELRKSLKTGEAVLGSNETLDVTKSGKSKLTVISATCPRDVEGKLEKYAEENGVPLYYYSGGGNALGLALGKPFSASTMAIIDPGDSNALELGENQE